MCHNVRRFSNQRKFIREEIKRKDRVGLEWKKEEKDRRERTKEHLKENISHHLGESKPSRIFFSLV